MTNHHRCFCELAPLYALDLLDFADRLWVEAQIIECPDLAEELAGYQLVVSQMSYSASPVPMAAEIEDRLFDRLTTSGTLDPVETIATAPQLTPSAPGILTMKATELDWKPHRIPGVDCALLLVDSVSRMRTMLVKAAAGVVYPLHQHRGVEEILMLTGQLEIEGQVYETGDYIRSQPNSIHAPSTTTGCMFLVRACMDDRYDESLSN
jgi:anti-sigma factor ChrR (cupin superfamily)